MKRLSSSFKWAFCGIINVFCKEQNFRIHTFIALCVVVAGILFKITAVEWSIVLICIGLVMSLECVNTAIEKLCDLYSTEKDEKIKTIKDISAGAVLISAIASSVVGMIIFFKYIFPIF